MPVIALIFHSFQSCKVARVFSILKFFGEHRLDAYGGARAKRGCRSAGRGVRRPRVPKCGIGEVSPCCGPLCLAPRLAKSLIALTIPSLVLAAVTIEGVTVIHHLDTGPTLHEPERIARGRQYLAHLNVEHALLAGLQARQAVDKREPAIGTHKLCRPALRLPERV